jgi:hypothetical protein
MVYLTMLPIVEAIRRRIDGLAADELETTWKEIVVAWFELLFYGGTEETLTTSQ